MIDYRQQILIEFKRLTKIDLELYFFKVELFFSTKRENIADYYKGNTNIPDNSAFALLEECLSDTYRIHNAFRLQRKQLDKLIYWELLEQIQDLRDSLETTVKLYKYLKSNLGKYNYSTNTTTKITLPKNNTLESVSREILEQRNWDNDYQQIAFKNDLSEEDYGSVSIDIELDLVAKNNTKPNVVIDTMIGDNCLGKDFANKIKFITTDSIQKIGTVSISIGSNILIGTGTSFLTDITLGDLLISGNLILGKVEEITDDNEIILDRESIQELNNIAYQISLQQDFHILSPQQTAKQSAETLLLLQQKHNPEFPLLGQDPAQNIGVSRSVFSLPSISRALNTVFSTDDTFTNIAVVELKIIDDNVSVVVDITTVQNEIIQLITIL